MLLRRPPQRTRTAKESGQNVTKKQSTATTTTTTEMITFQFEAKLYPLGALTEMPMLRLRPLPKPKRRPMLLPLLLLMMLRRTLEQSVRAKNRTQKAKKPNRQRSIQFFSFFLFFVLLVDEFWALPSKSQRTVTMPSHSHTHTDTHIHRERISGTVGLTALTERIQGRQKTGDWRIDSQPGSIPKSQLHFHCIFSCSYSCPDPTRPGPARSDPGPLYLPGLPCSQFRPAW